MPIAVRDVLSLALVSITLAHPCAAQAPPVSDADLAKLRMEVGQSLDRRYAAAGRRVDLAIYDMEELARQGRPASPAVVKRARLADGALRARWLGLEERRKAVFARVAAIPPVGDHVLTIDDLDVGSGDGGWVGLRSAKVEWPGGMAVELPIASFRNAAVVKGYEYHVTPAADAVFVYGKPNPRNTLLAGFNAPAGAAGAPRLILSGLDDDTPGIVRIRIAVDGHAVFEGPNPFRDNAWTEAVVPIPVDALAGAPPRDEAARTVAAEMMALRESTDEFGRWADGVADRIDATTAAARLGLRWKPMKAEPDFWQRHFLRGVCYVPFEQELTHHFRSFRHLGANMLYSYSGIYRKRYTVSQTLAAAHAVGIPYVQFLKDLTGTKGNNLGLGDPAGTVRRVRAFGREVAGKRGAPVNIAVDEPAFRDDIAADPNVLRDFRRYMDGRRAALTAAGIAVPAKPTPVLKPTSDADRPLWMEWQCFKRVELASHLRALWDGLQKDGAFPFVITQDLLSYFPQMASHVTIGRALPMISNDLYSNGAVREAFVMDMQRNASNGHAILTAGAGYSDKSPSRFRRSMAVGMAHAEGVLQWTDVYFDKYRDAAVFWSTANDDQGRDILTNWDPRYWSIMEQEYSRMARADRYLVGVKSTAAAAVLFSERTSISDTAGDPTAYVNGVLGVYSDLLRRSRPLDACFIEALSPEQLKRYRVLILPDARVIAPADAETLRRWVKSGGTLISTANASTCDQWGRPRAKAMLADVFGPLAAGQAGESGVVEHAYGRGKCFVFTDSGIGARLSGPSAKSGLYGAGRPQVTKALAALVDSAAGASAVRLRAPIDGMEMQVLRKGDAYVVHLVDWFDGRTLRGAELKISLPGRWRVRYPTDGSLAAQTGGVIAVRPFAVHEMLVIEPA
ncbi:MAG TPA: hypothetical protein VGM37_06755 [Armatimonadota bacterium]|jgi:hypothetical protein